MMMQLIMLGFFNHFLYKNFYFCISIKDLGAIFKLTSAKENKGIDVFNFFHIIS